MTLLSLETSGLYSKQKETFFPSKIKLNCACVHTGVHTGARACMHTGAHGMGVENRP